MLDGVLVDEVMVMLVQCAVQGNTIGFEKEILKRRPKAMVKPISRLSNRLKGFLLEVCKRVRGRKTSQCHQAGRDRRRSR